MLSVSSGYSPDYLLNEVAVGRENYYTGAVTEGEPPGRWWGAGAEALGLSGLVDAQDMRAVYERFLDPRAEGFDHPARWDELADHSTLGHAGRRYASEDELYADLVEREPDASPERRTELRTEAGKAARHNVAFLDVTFSVQKSVTVLHTAFDAREVAARTAGDDETADAWATYREAVEDAIWTGNNAALAYLQDHAGYARVGHHGGAAGRWVDAHSWVVASFFQHDSRDHDPQLHIHNPVLNRVAGDADGEWRTLDSRAMHKLRPAAAAVAERTTEERLAATLGVRLAMRPDGKAREVLGVDEAVCDLLSSRRRAVTAKAAELIGEFETRHGREANGLERDRLARQATLATRRAKSHDGETRTEFLDRVDTELRAEVAGGLGKVADDALSARRTDDEAAPAGAQSWSPVAVLETALADVQSRKAGWTRADLTRAINDALPDTVGLTDGAQVAKLLDTLTEQGLTLATPLDAVRPGDQVLPDALRLADGRSAYAAPGAQLYATPGHVHSESALLAAARKGEGPAVPRPHADQFLETLGDLGVDLGVDQSAAVRGVLTSGARVETLVGPAGTGKSFVVGTIAKAWTDPELRGAAAGRAFGLAASQVATDVLTAEGLTARNVARWLATQDRLADSPGNSHDDDRGWRLRRGDLVVVDESAMADTAALARIHDYVDRAGGKLLLVGDHRQLAAVGAGGAMDLLASQAGRHELTDTRRFHTGWEGPASLRLRNGDTTVLNEYHRAGRLLDAGTREQAEASASRAWLADTLAGRRSVLVVDTNEAADRLSGQLRADLVRLGRVAEDGVPLGLDGNTAGIGDTIAARRNGWHLIGHAGNSAAPINRATYTVTAVGDDGSLTVTPMRRASSGDDGSAISLTLPPEYVAADVSLAYAGTVHATQGATVDTSHLVATGSSSRAGVYVGLTRGREANTAHVATVTGPTDPAQGDEAFELHRDPAAVLAGVVAERDDVAAGAFSALAAAASSSAEAATTQTAGERFADAAALAATERTARWLDQLTTDGTLARHDRARLAAEDGAASLTRVLRRAELAGHDPHQVLGDAVTGRPLDGARNLTNVIHGRVRAAHAEALDPRGDTWTSWIPATGDQQWDTYLDELARAADRRAREVGVELAADPPRWATDALGAVPDGREAREEWTTRAAAVAGWRELRGIDDPDDALGAAPGPGQVESYAAYRAAWRALGRPEIDREELELSDGQLRVRVRAHQREATWAPRHVADELAGTRQAAARAHQDTELHRAEAASSQNGAPALLHERVEQTTALAAALDARADDLVKLDDARAAWLAHTAGTRAAAERARAELAARHADDTAPEPAVTAEEWLEAHRAEQADNEAHRVVTDADVPDAHDEVDDVAAPERVTEQPDDNEVTGAPLAEVGQVDIREVAAGEEPPRDENVVRVPSAEETASDIDRAHRALLEMRARDDADAAEEEAHRTDQLAQWQADDAVSDDTEPDDDEWDGSDVDAFPSADDADQVEA